MLREGFEASLIVGIVLAFLNRTGRRQGFGAVWAGTIAALALSVTTAALLFAIGAELEGSAEAIFEGSAMLFAASLLTWMIFWMRRQARSIKRELEEQVESALAKQSAFALALVAFVGVLREGVETALFLFGTVEGSNKLLASTSATVGLAGAVLLGYLFYRGAARLNLRRFVTVRLGGGRKRGVVVGLDEAPPSGVDVAPIERVVETLPSKLVELALWVAEYYGSTPGRALALIAPLKRKRRK